MAGNIRNMRVLIYYKSLEVYMQPLEKERQIYKQTTHMSIHILSRKLGKYSSTSSKLYEPSKRSFGIEFRRSSPRLLRTTDCHKCAC